jgi:hypothetical protein
MINYIPLIPCGADETLAQEMQPLAAAPDRRAAAGPVLHDIS